jgi:hypothetical protein
MIKKFSQYNESLRDQMTPVDIRDVIGDDIYENVYRVLEEKSKLFKPPFETEIKFASWSKRYISLYVKILRVTYIYKIEDGKWKTFYSWGRDNESRPEHFDTWSEAYQNMKKVLKKHFDRDLENENRNLGYVEKKISELKDTIQKIEEL